MNILIIGQGLAGTVLGFTLLKRGHKIQIYDQPFELSSTRVAAGLFNPITGMRRQKTWLAESLFPYLKTFYSELQNQLKVNFFHELPIFMPFSSVENQNEWMAKSGETYWKQWMKIADDPLELNGAVYNAYGGMLTQNSGWLDTKLFLDTCTKHFKELGVYTQKHVDESDILIHDDFVIYDTQKYDKVIFCNGLGAANSSYFSWLNHAHVKGDVFEIECESLRKDMAVNKNGFILPLPNGTFKAGSTYNNFFTDPWTVTPEGYNELHEKISNILNVPFKIVKHIAATRPATKDRKPLLGNNPDFKNVLIFNGLGTKGVSLAPYLANHFVNYLENKEALMPEVNVNRCLKHFKSNLKSNFNSEL